MPAMTASQVEAFEDAPDSDKNAEHYVRREFTLRAGAMAGTDPARP